MTKVDRLFEEAVSAHLAGRVSQAAKQYNIVLKIKPTHSHANNNLGIIEASLDNTKASLSLFRKALIITPYHSQFWAHYIEVLIKNSQGQASYALLQRAKITGLKRELIDQLESIFRSFMGPAINSNLIRAELLKLYREGRIEEIDKKRHELVALFSLDHDIFHIIGIAGFRLGNMEKAISMFKHAIALKPENSHAYSNLGMALHRYNKTHESICSYLRAITINALLPEAHNNLGVIYNKLDNFSEGLPYLKKAIGLRWEYTDARNNLSDSYAGLGELEEAIRELKICLIIKPDCPNLANNMGAILNDGRNYTQATVWFQRSTKLKVGFADAHMNLANTFREQGYYDKAVMNYDIVGGSLANARSVECLYILKRYNEVNTRLKDLARLDPKNLRVVAFSNFYSHQLGVKDVYPFCREPLKFIMVDQIQNYSDNNTGFINDILFEVNQHKLVWEPKNKSTNNGLQTQNSLNIFQSGTACQKLEMVVKKVIHKYYMRFNDSDDIFIREWPSDFFLTGWFVRLLKGGYQTPHIHASGWLSGVIYLKQAEAIKGNEGAIEFGLHGADLPLIKDGYPKTIHNPTNGDIVLFPSSLYHKTIPFKANTERCIISFDVVPRG